MVFGGNRKRVGQRLATRRLWHLPVGAVAVLLLTGANGEGCGGEPSEESGYTSSGGMSEAWAYFEGPCPEGMHMEWECDVQPTAVTDPQGDTPEPHTISPGSNCAPLCVPDDPCPEGMHLEWVCEAHGTAVTDPQGDTTPTTPCSPEPECTQICVPD